MKLLIFNLFIYKTGHFRRLDPVFIHSIAEGICCYGHLGMYLSEHIRASISVEHLPRIKFAVPQGTCRLSLVSSSSFTKWFYQFILPSTMHEDSYIHTLANTWYGHSFQFQTVFQPHFEVYVPNLFPSPSMRWLGWSQPVALGWTLVCRHLYRGWTGGQLITCWGLI